MSVPNAPAGQPPTAINPTGVGDDVPLVANQPLSQLPATASALVNWTPNDGPDPTPRATTPVASQSAGILAADGTVVPGTTAPFVVGNVIVGTNQVGTSVVLTPQQ